MHAVIKARVEDLDEQRRPITHVIETSYGRMLFNQMMPKGELPFYNGVVGKKNLRLIIGEVIKYCGIAESSAFLDRIKNLGYYMSYKAGLSFNLSDVIVPKEKEEIIADGFSQVEEIMDNFNFGIITDNPTSRKGSPYSTTSSPPTVPVRDSPIRHSRPPTPVT